MEEVQKSLSLGDIQKVLQGLLREQVSIRNMIPILETLADYGPISKDTAFLIEKVRQTLGRQICLQYADEDRKLRVLTIDPALEQAIIDSRVDTAAGVVAALEPEMKRSWITAVRNAVKRVQDEGLYPVIWCSEAARALVKSSTEREIPDLVVISVPEVVTDIGVESLGVIQAAQEAKRQET